MKVSTAEETKKKSLSVVAGTQRVKLADRIQWITVEDDGPGIPEDVRKHIVSVCKRVYRHLELSGYARIDLRLRDDGRVFVMEANPNPQLAYGEDFAESAHTDGIEYHDLLQRLLNQAMRRRARGRA